MNGTQPEVPANAFHEQELRIALVMNGGVSLAVWIGGATQEINRLVSGETVYGRLCDALRLHPRVDIISGTSAGGINGALLALAMSQGKPLDPLRDIGWTRGTYFPCCESPPGRILTRCWTAAIYTRPWWRGSRKSVTSRARRCSLQRVCPSSSP